MARLPVPPDVIETKRLKLVRLTDTTLGSKHVQLFHENWSDAGATGWRYRPHVPHPSSYAITSYPLPMLLALKHQSLHGATKSLEESRLWMVNHIEKFDNWFYAVFELDCSDPVSKEDVDGQDGERLGTHLGSVSLRLAPIGLELPPPSPEELGRAPDVGMGTVLSEEEVSAREEMLQSVRMNVRTLGYALFAHAQGKGYATEACKGLFDGYSSSIRAWRASDNSKDEEGQTPRESVFYIEAGVDQENPGSQKVLQKLGFRTVGMKMEKEKAWLNGAWRGPGWWITGKYL